MKGMPAKKHSYCSFVSHDFPSLSNSDESELRGTFSDSKESNSELSQRTFDFKDCCSGMTDFGLGQALNEKRINSMIQKSPFIFCDIVQSKNDFLYTLPPFRCMPSIKWCRLSFNLSPPE